MVNFMDCLLDKFTKTDTFCFVCSVGGGWYWLDPNIAGVGGCALCFDFTGFLGVSLLNWLF